PRPHTVEHRLNHSRRRSRSLHTTLQYRTLLKATGAPYDIPFYAQVQVGDITMDFIINRLTDGKTQFLINCSDE
ncbi:hypothetical protein WG66_015538, partial [Moniliophthora roreri]